MSSNEDEVPLYIGVPRFSDLVQAAQALGQASPRDHHADNIMGLINQHEIWRRTLSRTLQLVLVSILAIPIPGLEAASR